MVLTQKRRVFIEEYLRCWNATEAARNAGFAFPTRSGWRLMQDSDVKAEIKARLDEKAMSADEVLSRLAAQARVSFGDFITVEGPETWKVDLEKAQSAQKLGLIKNLWRDRNGKIRLELHDQQRALELLAKYHHLFSDGTEVSVNIGPAIIIDNGPD